AVSLVADIHGRSSLPRLDLSSDPGVYNQSQLFGFFMGGEPGGDPGEASRDAAAGAGASLLSSKLAGQVSRAQSYLPIRIVDTLRYDPANSTSSETIRGGRKLTRHIYVEGREHPNPRPDENPME